MPEPHHPYGMTIGLRQHSSEVDFLVNLNLLLCCFLMIIG
jgi:hypothetical protein